MPNIVAGFLKNGVVVPNAPLPEGAFVEVHLIHGPIESPPKLQEETVTRVSPGELRKMPHEQRQAILEAAAKRAEQDYRTDEELTGFDAFSEEERDDDDESDSHS